MPRSAALVALALLFVAPMIAVPATALLAAPPPGDGPALALVPPWQDADAILAAAGARAVGPARAPFALIVADALPPGAVPFGVRLRAAGVLVARDAAPLAVLCGAAR